jgi:hypothetical protein
MKIFDVIRRQTLRLAYFLLLIILTICSLFAKCFTSQNSRHQKSTDTTHSNHGIIFFTYVVFEIQQFSAISPTFSHHHCQSCCERHFYSAAISEKWSTSIEGHPLNCPFCPKINCATYTLMDNSHYNFFWLIKEFMGLYGSFQMSTQNLIITLCSASSKNIINCFELWRSCLDRFKPRYLYHFGTLNVPIFSTLVDI